ncbi:MAG: hypothetical protein ABEI86_02020 [Halobacteriaceae archaeon]
MVVCNECGYDAQFASGEWEYAEEGKTLDPPIVVVECPECSSIVETRVEL